MSAKMKCHPPCRHCGKGLYFTSHANVDRKPHIDEHGNRWAEPFTHSRLSGCPACDTHLDPRPEFDRSVNPLLAIFRQRVEANTRTTVARHASAWLVSFPALTYGTNVTDAQADHARKVLIRLAERPAS